MPLIPESISSNIIVGTLYLSPITCLKESIILDISPPEAIFARGIRGSPGFVEIRNSTSSKPSLSIILFLEIFTSKSEFVKFKSCSSKLISSFNFSPYLALISLTSSAFELRRLYLSSIFFLYSDFRYSKSVNFVSFSLSSSLYFRISRTLILYFLIASSISLNRSCASLSSFSEKYIESLSERSEEDASSSS